MYSIVVDLPKGGKAISFKWFFKVKLMLMVRYIKTFDYQGVDYDEMFSPVAKMTKIRSVISVAENKGLILTHSDGSNCVSKSLRSSTRRDFHETSQKAHFKKS